MTISNKKASPAEYAQMPIEQFMALLRSAGKLDFSDKLCFSCKKPFAMQDGRLLRLGINSRHWQCDICFTNQTKKLNQMKRNKR